MNESWGEATRGFPCGAYVRSLTDDGVFVQVGSVGKIVGRHFPGYPSFASMNLEIEWSDETKTTVPRETVERIQQDQAGAA